VAGGPAALLWLGGGGLVGSRQGDVAVEVDGDLLVGDRRDDTVVDELTDTAAGHDLVAVAVQDVGLLDHLAVGVVPAGLGAVLPGEQTHAPGELENAGGGQGAANIKSHHNVGGLPDYMKLKIVEPLRTLFKDEVRRVGASLGIPAELLGRHPFPGPGLAIRILGDITPEKVATLQEVDAIFINALKDNNLYDKVWQAGAILLPINSVGVMGDERTYEKCVALRAVESTDGMTADWVHLPYEFLQKVSNEIINKVKGVNRVVYDISSKPPATIEWE